MKETGWLRREYRKQKPILFGSNYAGQLWNVLRAQATDIRVLSTKIEAYLTTRTSFLTVAPKRFRVEVFYPKFKQIMHFNYRIKDFN